MILVEGVENLKQLQVLDVMGNQLRTLPTEIGQCTQLIRLLVDRNLLRWLPRSLSTLTNLEEVSAASNRLLYLPLGNNNRTDLTGKLDKPVVRLPDIGDMKSLKSVYVDNNPYLHAVPLSISHQELGFNRLSSSEPRYFVTTL